MTSATPWRGTKRIAFVPLFRSNAVPPDEIPSDWENVILNRVINDPRPEVGGADRSLRAWLRAVSWGQADIDPVVLPMQTIDKREVDPWDLDERPWQDTTLGRYLRNDGVQAAQLVMLGDRPSGTSSIRGFWSRVVMDEINGTWLMELIHTLTGFKDLYAFANDTDPPERSIGLFDEMSAATQIHPTVFTKNELGWLDARHIARTNIEHLAQWPLVTTLHPIGHPVPPWQTLGQIVAVRVGDSVPYVMIEARKKTDQFEVGIKGIEDGIPSEGVIVYRVQTRNPTVQEREGGKLPLYLVTQTALKIGESVVFDDVNLRVDSEFSDGFHISLSLPLVAAPDVTGFHPDMAKRKIESRGLDANHVGCNRQSCRVESQDPIGGTRVPKYSRVTYYSYDESL